MNGRAPAGAVPVLAFLSGAPSLAYQVIWTREAGLLAGSQIEAISLVLVAFFGGLALGSRLLGPWADRAASPLRLYAGLEVGAALLALLSPLAFDALAAGARPLGERAALLAAAGGIVLPVTFLLGGSQPALLRAAARGDDAARHAGRVVGANTAGAVAGVLAATLAIPALGLWRTAVAAGLVALATGLAALALARPGARPARTPAPEAAPPVAPGVLVAAGLAGTATLAWEVLSARQAGLLLGSSLYAWALVLSLFLVGLAAGNLAGGAAAGRTREPTRLLGWLECGAALALLGGSAALRPPLAEPAAGLVTAAIAPVVAGVLPASFLMGAAFPGFVRLAVRGEPVAAGFGRVAAVNTAGGVAGALLAPFVLLPALGSVGAAAACAAANALIGLALLARAPGPRGRHPALALVLLAVAASAALRQPAPADDPWVLFVAEGRQGTAVVTESRGARTLVVDGDPEASTVGDARYTELLLAAFPLLLHPEPRRFLEVGFGSGITLGTAGRFPLEQVACVEIAGSVLEAAPWFEPDNRGIAASGAAEIVRGDARVFLARHPASYDVVAANTLHPWSLGATGLYSRQYFARLAEALRPGGIAVQWLPVDQIGAETFRLILRTFFDVFPEGGLWWGPGNVFAVGSQGPLPSWSDARAERRLGEAGLSFAELGIADAAELPARRLADAAGVRTALGPGPVLDDDRPVLERLAAGARGERHGALFEVLVGIAQAGEPRSGALLLWMESLAARASGQDARADAREQLAQRAGFAPARRARAARLAQRAHREFAAGRVDEAAAGFDDVLTLDPEQREALIGRAGVAVHRGRFAAARALLERRLATDPGDALALNELASVRYRLDDLPGARRAVARALAANPYSLDSLANAGLLALAAGDRATAEEMLGRLRAASPLGVSAQERALAAALDAAPAS